MSVAVPREEHGPPSSLLDQFSNSPKLDEKMLGLGGGERTLSGCWNACSNQILFSLSGVALQSPYQVSMAGAAPG